MTWGVTTNSENQKSPVSNVSGTVPAMTTVKTPKPSGPIGYASKTALFCGVVKVLAGITCSGFGLLQGFTMWRLHLGRRESMFVCTADHFCALVFIATGAVAISASKHKSPKRIAASLGMAFISVMLSAAFWVYMIYFGATRFDDMKQACRRRYHHHGSHGSHGSGHRGHHRGKRGIFDSSHHSEMLIPALFLVASIFIFIMLMIVFSVSILQAVVCYRAYKTANRYRTMEEDTTYIVPFKTKEKMMADEDDLPKMKV